MSLPAEEFDYVIVGAGSAGCVLAARLSQSGRQRVLLIEAGPEDRSFWIHVPLGYSKVFADPSVNWMFEGDPEPGLMDRPTYQPRGKVLGGTSSINGMIYIRGNHADYDGWRDSGCAGWGWDDVRPYFDRAEGPDGLKVTSNPVKHPLAEAVLKAAQRTGMAFNPDFNGAAQEGVGYYRYNIHRGRRWSAARAYLAPARSRSNLKVVTGALVRRVLLADGRATGVEYEIGDQVRTAAARAEVILSAGVFGSPRILELSGIGDARRLSGLGIAPLLHAPAVGENLQDHFFTQLMFRCTKAITINELANSRLHQLWEGARYLLTHKGKLASNHLYIGGFAHSRPGLPKPDIQFNMTAWSVAERTSSGAKAHPFPGFSLSPVHINPDARGATHIRSTDLRQQNAIRFNYLMTDYDAEAMLFGIRMMRQIAAQPEVQPYIAQEIQPGPDIRSDDEMIDFLRRKAVSNLHAAGSCRMGPSPQDSVVDPELRVHGLRGLRVVDGSIMPRIVSGNSHAATVMIAEKASDLILTAARQG